MPPRQDANRRIRNLEKGSPIHGLPLVLESSHLEVRVGPRRAAPIVRSQIQPVLLRSQRIGREMESVSYPTTVLKRVGHLPGYPGYFIHFLGTIKPGSSGISTSARTYPRRDSSDPIRLRDCVGDETRDFSKNQPPGCCGRHGGSTRPLLRLASRPIPRTDPAIHPTASALNPVVLPRRVLLLVARRVNAVDSDPPIVQKVLQESLGS